MRSKSSAQRSEKRKTPRYPSHLKRNATTRRPAAKYIRGSYEVAVDRVCDLACPPPDPVARRADETVKAWQARLTPEQRGELKAWRKAHRWSPNQLRHTFGTLVRKQYGLEAAQVLLGHSRADVTQVYAERNEALATEVAKKIG